MARSRRLGMLLLALALLARPVQAAPAQAAPAPATTAPCYAAAMAALTKQGALYSQGGQLSNDPIDPSTGTYYPRTGPHSFDCSGLVWWAYAQAGITIGTTTYSQENNGTAINCTLGDLHGIATTCWTLGDLVFLSYSGGQHVAIYVGQGLFMDCYNHTVGCVLHDVSQDSFYWAHFWQARRIVSGCEDLTLDPGTPTTTPSTTPDLESIPNLLPYVTFTIAQCDACTEGSAGQPALVHQPAPATSWYDLGSVIQWLAWAIEDTMIDVLCWLLNMLQMLVNIITSITNVVIDGINQFWRFFVYVWLSIRALFYALWPLFELLRDFMQQAGAFFLQAGAWLPAIQNLLLLALQLAGQLLQLLLGLALALLDLLGWIGGLAIGLALSILAQLGATTTPSVLAPDGHVVYGMVRGALEALRDSQLGWLLYLAWALAYVGFVFWLARFLSASKED